MSEEPRRPDDSECCGSGCKPCIFDVYEEKLKKWKEGNLKAESKALNQIKYLPFIITNIQTITNYLKVFTFQSVALKTENNNETLIRQDCNVKYEFLNDFLKIKAGEYLIMKGVFKKDDKEVIISRSYTPVVSNEFENGVFSVIIAFTKNGQMSQFLQTLNTNDIIFWRGPYLEFNYIPNKYKHVLLIGGGTGVVPLYNISKTIVENEEDETWVNVFCSFRTTQTILLRKEFKNLRDFWNFKMTTFISGENDNGEERFNETILFRKMNGDDVINEVKRFGSDDFLVVICGPVGFIEFFKSHLDLFGVKNENIFIFW